MNREEMKYNVRKRWVFFGLPFTFTVYHIGEDLLTIDTGFFKLEQNDCYMYKITDAKLTRRESSGSVPSHVTPEIRPIRLLRLST